MRESIGSVFLYNMIIVFIVIIFAFLAITFSYTRAYKVNNRIATIIEKYEGYNDEARQEIEKTLKSIGYMTKKSGEECKSRDDGNIVIAKDDSDYYYCVYYIEEDERYYDYGITTYMSYDLPFLNIFIKIPIYTKTNRNYLFTE